MATKLSRRKLSDYAAERLVRGDKASDVMRSVAAYLIESGREREAELIVRDIETKLLGHGIALATVVSARQLSDEAKQSIEQMIKDTQEGVTTVYLRESVEPDVIGGVKVILPHAQMDATVKAKLEKLGV